VGLILANLRAPPSLRLLSERIMIRGCLGLREASSLGVGLLVVLVLVYRLMLFFNLTHGKPSIIIPENRGRVKELALLYAHRV